MKRLNKNQKLIILTSIITVIVIIGIVIGANIIKTNIANGEYNSSNSDSNNGNLLPEYIKKGITLGGVTGTLEDLDTSDATATPEDIAKGKTAYVDGVKITGTRVEAISELNSDEVYYADIEGDGIVDGVIFADLMIGGSEKWGIDNYANRGPYEIPVETNLKEYYVKEESYTDDFGTGKVIAPMKDTSGNNRFYVMALDDFDSKTHYWYYGASGNLSDRKYDISFSTNDFAKAGAEPTGKVNTERMINSWNAKQYGSQNSNDVWKIIQDEAKSGWFLPSKSEWAAFGASFNITKDDSLNNKFNLSRYYWTSTQYDQWCAYVMYFCMEYLSNDDVFDPMYVRLATTF